MKIPESIHELIAKAPFAHMTTVNSTGGLQVTVVWVGIEGEDFVVGHLHLPTYQKVKNIQRDPRVALSMLSDATNAQGLREYLVVYGDARVTEGGAFDLLQRLGRLYVGPNAVYHRPPCAIFRVGSRESHPRALPEWGRGLCQLLTNEPQTCPMRAGDVRENQRESEVL